MKLTFPCVCCGHLTLGESPGFYEICPVCFWEGDRVQLRWPNWVGGANRPSLIEAQANFMELGACEERFATKVRPPRDDEPLDPNWRSIDPEHDDFEPRGTGGTVARRRHGAVLVALSRHRILASWRLRRAGLLVETSPPQPPL
ncbi:CPCC family cysteine-rich protein [Streptomyces sp. SD31]|uniref:CPCC family cysteine-rich protein n=1 Tax=Streptomyces sp. SD31 TaxID=3452208 RepID=UPI003F88D524